MIEKFELNQMEKFSFSGLPCEWKHLEVKDSIVVLRIDQDIWDVEHANSLIETIKKGFPNIDFMFLYNGIQIEGVIHK